MTVPPVATFHLDDHGVSRDELGKTPRRPRAGADLRYARVAAKYVEALKRNSRSVAADVAAEMNRGGGNYEAKHVKELIYEARRRDLLSPTQRGHSGGRLTEKGQAVLRDAGHLEADASPDT